MHLCVDARMYHASGIGTYLQNLLPVLSQSFELTLIGNPDELSALGEPVIATKIPIYSVSELFRFPSLIPWCDVFWSPHYNVPLLPVRARKRLVTIHDVFHLAYFHTLSLKQKLYAKQIFAAAAQRSDHIVTVSEFSKSEIKHYLNVPSEKVTVIPNGVNHTLFRVIKDQTTLSRVREKYKLPIEFMLYVGNVKPHKNLSTLVRAFAHLPESLASVHLVVVGKKEGFITGDHALFDTIEQNPQLAQRVHFTGFVEEADLPVLYSLARLFVFPSYYEGFGLPPLEAMACGCPTVVSSQASMPEICGAAATYVDPKNASAMATTIQHELGRSDDGHQRKIQLGLTQAQKYTWKQAVIQHKRLIRTLS